MTRTLPVITCLQEPAFLANVGARRVQPEDGRAAAHPHACTRRP